MQVDKSLLKFFKCPFVKIDTNTKLKAEVVKRRKNENYYIRIKALNGKELDVLIVKGSTIPHYSTSSYVTTWWSLYPVAIIEPVKEPFKVYLISKLHKKRNDYVVYPNEKVTSTRLYDSIYLTDD